MALLVVVVNLILYQAIEMFVIGRCVKAKGGHFKHSFIQ